MKKIIVSVFALCLLGSSAAQVQAAQIVVGVGIHAHHHRVCSWHYVHHHRVRTCGWR